MTLAKDVKLGTVLTLPCGCNAEMWRRWTNSFRGRHSAEFRGGPEHWIKVFRKCNRNTCILSYEGVSSEEVRHPVPWDTKVTIDPLALELEEKFGEA